ncbi:MAG: hypothetical protein PVI57_11865 [Gemmatimonadota bacterium]|jgi:hypothetical protein
MKLLLGLVAPLTALTLVAGGTGRQAADIESSPVPSSDQASAPTVTISLVDGQVTVDPDPVTVNRGDTLVFVADPDSDIESFNVQFRSPVPFGAQAAVAGLNGARRQSTRDIVRAQAAVGQRYKYNVRVWDGQRMIPLDPEVVIGPGE